MTALFSETTLAQATTNDYDRDDDGLIEVSNLAQLNAIRWDLNGDGQVDSSSNSASYATAFPDAQASMGCPSSGCIGYKLTTNLDFTDTDGDGDLTDEAYWNGGSGWLPIGLSPTSNTTGTYFNTTFDGNNHTISNLFINRPGGRYIGLFRFISKTAKVRNLGLKNVDVTSTHYTGALSGGNRGEIIACYVTGEVKGVRASASTTTLSYATGGLVGTNREATSSITRSYSTAKVTGEKNVGGLVGEFDHGSLKVAYATGIVHASTQAGGLNGYYSNYDARASMDSVYSIGKVVSGDGLRHGGLIGVVSSIPGKTMKRAYWDELTSLLTAYASNKTPEDPANQIQKRTTRDLQMPKSYTVIYPGQDTPAIYADWDIDLDGDGSGDDPWDFGRSRQYPTIDGVPGQRRAFIHPDHWNTAIVGEPVTVGLIGNLRGKRKVSSNGDGAGNWKWERSPNGVSGWEDISSRSLANNNRSYLLIPESGDANYFLRAYVTIVDNGKEEKVYTNAIVIRAKTNRTSTDTSASAAVFHSGHTSPRVGQVIRVEVNDGDWDAGNRGDSVNTPVHRSYWRWERCDNSGMTTNCGYVFSLPISASDEYTPVVADAGKYLRAYVYYTDKDNNNVWSRAATNVIGPVGAAANPSS